MCHVPPYDPNSTIRRKNNNESNEISLEEKFEKSIELEMKLLHSKLKNYAHKFEENSIVDATSAYVEFDNDGRRVVFRKTSVCCLLRKESFKCSSDRKFRVRYTQKAKKNNVKKLKPAKTQKVCNKFGRNKSKMTQKK